MRVSRKFGERTPVIKSPEKAVKYYLVFEGKETEPIYFDALNRFREELGIHPRIELVFVERSYSEESWSHPQKLTGLIEKYREESEKSVCTYQLLIDWVLDSIMEEKGIQGPNPWTKSLRAVLALVCEQKMGRKLTDTFPFSDLEAVCGELAQHISALEDDEAGMSKTVSLMPQIIQLVFSAYNEQFDKICLITDRDWKSFRPNQYRDVLKACQEKNIGFYPTNPNFEFWLLMHYDDVHTLDKEKLWENPRSIPEDKESPRYTETELRKRMPDYQKKKYDVDTFMKRIDVAIKNETAFCEDEELLKDKIGSRVGILIQALRGNQGP